MLFYLLIPIKKYFVLNKSLKQIKMKKLKIVMLALFATAFIGNVNAQDSSRQWAISFGVNIVDVRAGDDFLAVSTIILEIVTGIGLIIHLQEFQQRNT